MKSPPAFALALCLLAAGARGEELSSSATEELFEAPGGRAIAILMPGVARRTGEERDGFVHVTLDGWVRLPVSPAAKPSNTSDHEPDPSRLAARPGRRDHPALSFSPGRRHAGSSTL